MRLLPILFNTEMVRAVSNDLKTVTRRVVKPQPLFYTGRKYIFADDVIPKKWVGCSNIIETYQYQPGDILYMPQPWKCYAIWDDMGYEVEFQDGEYVKFEFTDLERAKKWAKYLDKPAHQWQSPYFMPKEAARLFLRVTNVRAERLQDITVDGILREGIDVDMPPICKEAMDPDFPTDEQRAVWERMSQDQRDEYVNNRARHTYMGWCDYADRLFSRFKGVWNSTLKPKDLPLYGWEANPWVWVIEFERISKEEALKCQQTT